MRTSPAAIEQTRPSGPTGQRPYQQDNVVDIWDKVAKDYDQTAVAGPDYKAYLRVIRDCVGDPAGKTFCEVGCGSATTSALLRGRRRVTLVDLSPKALSFAREHFDRLGLTAEYRQENGLCMSFPDGTFDVVWNGGVIEHFLDDGKVQLIQEMWRVVRPGGTLLIKVPNQHDFPFMIGKALAVWRRTWKYGYEDDLTIRRCRSLTRRAGLVDVSCSRITPSSGGGSCPAASGSRRRSAGIPTIGTPGGAGSATSSASSPTSHRPDHDRRTAAGASRGPAKGLRVRERRQTGQRRGRSLAGVPLTGQAVSRNGSRHAQPLRTAGIRRRPPAVLRGAILPVGGRRAARAGRRLPVRAVALPDQAVPEAGPEGAGPGV